MQSHVEGVGVVGAEPHGEILEGRHLERRTITSSNARAIGRAVGTRHETRSSDTLTRRVSSRECATQKTGGRRPAKWRPRWAVTSLPAGSNRRIPRAGDERQRVVLPACHAAHRKKSRFARNVCIRSHYFLSGQFCARGNIATDGKISLRAGDGGRGGRRVGRQRMLLDRLPAAKAVFPWWTGHSRPRRALGQPIKCASPDALRDAPKTRTSW